MKGLGYDKFNLCYDYLGIEKHDLYEWASSNEFIGEYIAKMRILRSEMDINFVKVVSLSNDVYNEYADSIAKKACGITWYYF